MNCKYIFRLVVVASFFLSFCGCGKDEESHGFASSEALRFISTGNEARQTLYDWLDEHDVSLGYDEEAKKIIVTATYEFDLKGGRRNPAITSYRGFENRRNVAFEEVFKRAVEKLVEGKLEYQEKDQGYEGETNETDSSTIISRSLDVIIGGVQVIFQSESFDSERGRYQIAIAVEYDINLEKDFKSDKSRSVCGTSSIDNWVKSQEFSRMIGGRVVSDVSGKRWLIGIASSCQEDEKDSRTMRALGYALGSFGGRLRSTRKLQKKHVGGKWETSFDMTISFAPIFSKCKYRKVFHHQVSSVFYEKPIFVTVVALSFEDCLGVDE